MEGIVYKGRKTNEISFPLGGIGAGCVGLAGNGRLIDWEIFNKPNKGSLNGLSHFAVKAERDGKVLDARILQGDLHPPYSGQLGVKMYSGFGFGASRENLCGMPHFRKHAFKGGYPFARLSFGGEKSFPGKARLLAWSPFIPSNDKDSSLPAALFEISLSNNTRSQIDYTVVAALSNPFGQGGAVNRYSSDAGLHQLYMSNSLIPSDSTDYGDICLSTDAKDVSFQEYWFRGGWCDSLETYWQELLRPGRFKNRSYKEGRQGCWEGRDTGHIAAHVRVKPGAKARIRFAITWNVPNCRNYWNNGSNERAEKAGIPKIWKNWYATQWRDSADSGKYALQNWKRMAFDTELFQSLLFGSSLPKAAVDAVSATMSVLKSPTCLRLEDGTFYGWEGTGCVGGCCEGSCTHVWNYQQALAFLFPKLERSMRTANYKYCVDENGGSHFRIQLPLGVKAAPEDFRPCADGQFGDVVKTYRDWKISGDTDWLRSVWPSLKKTIEYAWSPENKDKWDPEKTGVLHGRQHHTLDMELFGPNSWLTGFYLAALKAAAEMADVLGEPDFARELRGIFERGSKWTEENLFNGEYYGQRLNLKDKDFLKSFEAGGASMSGGVMEAYWSEELGEIKYQLGGGIALDAVLAQWHANICGLGRVFDQARTARTLRANYKYNFKKSMRDEYNPWRIFSVNDEGGAVICAWPRNRERPAIPVPYSQEAMHGFEYAAAVHMIQAGMLDEGMEIVKSVRSRYDGEKRNPWNEIECGSNYARSMAAYALLNAFSGFQFDMPRKSVSFNPIQKGKSFACFWALDGSWGRFSAAKGGKASIELAFGTMDLKSVGLPFAPRKIYLGRKAVDFEMEDGQAVFKQQVRLEKKQALRFTA